MFENLKNYEIYYVKKKKKKIQFDTIARKK
jgi:hypothetical protein